MSNLKKEVKGELRPTSRLIVVKILAPAPMTEKSTHDSGELHVNERGTREVTWN